MISAEAAARALCELFLANADRGDNAANDHLIAEIVGRIRTQQEQLEVTPTMPAQPPRTGYNRWRDVDGTPIPVPCRIEQIAVSKEHGALASRLHQQGQVIGQGTKRLQVRFDDNQVMSLRPHLVRVLEKTPDGNQ